MNRKLPVSVALAVTLIAMTVTFAITMLVSMDYFNNAVRSVTQMQAQYSKLADLDSYVRGNYYGEIDDAMLSDRMAQGYLAGVGDKYSVYYTEKEYAELQEFEQGTRVDIGVALVLEADGYFRIARVFSGSPADKAGVKAGGRILMVDGTDAKTVTSVKAMNSLLRGLQGTELKLTCLYKASEEEEYTVQRTNYTLPSVEYKKAGDFGYIRIYGFEKDTDSAFEKALDAALEDGVKGLLFDLRGNAGNVYQSAYNIVNRICPRGTVAKSEAKNGTVKVLATSDDERVDLPMTVLVDGNTAAAAELFAVNVRDLAGGQIAGVKTAGKWMLQSAPQRLSDGSAVSVTVAKLLTGNDENFEGTGLPMDVSLDAMQPDSDTGVLWNPDPEKDQWILRGLEVLRALTAKTSEAEQQDLNIVPPSSSQEAKEGRESKNEEGSKTADSTPDEQEG